MDLFAAPFLCGQISTATSMLVSSLLSQIFYPLRTHVNYNAVWGHPPIQRQNRNAKKLMTEKLPESGLRSVIS